MYSEIRSCTHNNSSVGLCMATKLGQDDVRQHSGCHRCRCCVRCRCRPRNSSDAESCTDNNSFLAVCTPTKLAGGSASAGRSASTGRSALAGGVALAGVVPSAGGVEVAQGQQFGRSRIDRWYGIGMGFGQAGGERSAGRAGLGRESCISRGRGIS